jgi:hypothetical protein
VEGPPARAQLPFLHLPWLYLQRPEQQGSQLLQHAQLKGRSMRGAWRSALLQVSAAQQPAEEREGEGQQQRQVEELLGREPHPCVAGATLERVGDSSGHIPPRLRCGVLCQTDTLRMGKLGISCAAFRPMYIAAREKTQQRMRHGCTMNVIRELRVSGRNVHAVRQAMEWQRPSAAAVVELPRSMQAAHLALPGLLEREPC